MKHRAKNVKNSNQQMNAMQNTLRSLLNSFYTGAGLSLKNKIVYPSFLLGDKGISWKMRGVQETIASLKIYDEQEIFIVKDILSKQKKYINVKDLTFFLSSCFSFLEEKAIRRSEKKSIKITIPSIEISAYPSGDMEYIKVFKELQRIGERLKREKKGKLLLFGSLATQDYVKGHSDLDTVFIISKEACKDQKLLVEIRKDIAEIMRESYFVDPLQHHGPYMFTEYDLERFPQYYLPFAVWKNMVSLCGDVVLSLSERESSKEEIVGELSRYKEMFLKIIKSTGVPSKDNYSRKCLYQAILLFPAVILTAKGNPCYKRESFQNIKRYTKEKGNELIDMLSEIWRENGFKTAPASPFVQSLFRMVSYPFIYPFIYRVVVRNTLAKKKRKKLNVLMKEAAVEFVAMIDEELNHLGKKKRK